MTLILLPNLLYDFADIDLWLPKKLGSIIASLDGLIAESEKNARKYLSHFLSRQDFNKIKIRLLNEHTRENELKDLTNEVSFGKWGLISDSGLPCLADPGSLLVKYANEKNILVQAIAGPSSIFLALMLCGLNTGRFAFHGYLPRKDSILIQKIRSLENESSKQKIIQVFIEAPYRSDRILSFLKMHLKDLTLLCIAINLTSKDEKVITKSMKEFKKMDLKIGKRPCVFLIQAF